MTNKPYFVFLFLGTFILSMTFFRKLKLYYLKYFTCEETRWKLFLNEIFSSFTTSVDTLKEWEKIIDFNVEKYSRLLEISLPKNNHCLSIYLLKEKELAFPVEQLNKEKKIFTKTYILDQIMSNNLLEKDPIAWLGLLSCHHPFHLLKTEHSYNVYSLEKRYNPEEYKEVCQLFFNYPRFKPFYLIKERQDMILSLCHSGAKEMISHIFLDMALEKKSFNVIKKNKI